MNEAQKKKVSEYVYGGKQVNFNSTWLAREIAKKPEFEGISEDEIKAYILQECPEFDCL